MPKYQLIAHVTVSAYTTIEATSLEEAITLAADREVIIGGVGSGEDEEDSWIIDDADGQARSIGAAEVTNLPAWSQR